MVDPNEGAELGVRDGEVPGRTLRAVDRIEVGIYDGIAILSFLYSTDVITYLDLGVVSLRYLHISINIPETG